MFKMLKGKHQTTIGVCLSIGFLTITIIMCILAALLYENDPPIIWTIFLIVYVIMTVVCIYIIQANVYIAEKSNLRKLKIKANDFDSLTLSCKEYVSSQKYINSLDRRYETNGITYAFTYRRKVYSNNVLLFVDMKNMAEFNLERDMHDIWADIRQQYDDLKNETMMKRRRRIVITYCICVEKDSEEFQQYLDDNIGKYDRLRRYTPIFIKKDNWGRGIGGAIYSGGVDMSMLFLATGICFEKSEASILVPNGFNYNLWTKKCIKLFTEMMERC